MKENIEVDLTDLQLNGNVRVEDVKVDNYEILNSPRIPIASIVLTRELTQEETAVAAPAGGAAAAPATPHLPMQKNKTTVHFILIAPSHLWIYGAFFWKLEWLYKFIYF